jgi:hypothetical protein
MMQTATMIAMVMARSYPCFRRPETGEYAEADDARTEDRPDEP